MEVGLYGDGWWPGSGVLGAGPADVSSGQLALLVVIVVAIIIVMISTRRRLRDRQHSPKAYVRERTLRVRQEKAVIDDVSGVMIQLEQLARELTAQIDTHFAKLEQSIRDADARIRQLQALTGVNRDRPVLDTVIDDATPLDDPTPATGRPAADDPRSMQAAIGTDVSTVASVGGEGGSNPAGVDGRVGAASGASRDAADDAAVRVNRNGLGSAAPRLVSLLAEAGKSSEQIAAHLTIPTGEVELMLAMRRRRDRETEVRSSTR